MTGITGSGPVMTTELEILTFSRDSLDKKTGQGNDLLGDAFAPQDM